MLESSRSRILERVPPDALVVDVGGWADPVERADWVIDAMPYESRGLYRRKGWIDRPAEPERFTSATWLTRDLCHHDPLPFDDGEVDFVICAHTLEDLRDPLWVCGELIRIARAGYIEVPSRQEEQSLGVEGPWAGYRHHRWLIDVSQAGIEFVMKDHSLHSDPASHFPAGFLHALTIEDRVSTLWWEDSFSFRERLFIEDLPGASYMPDFVARETAKRPSPQRSGPARRARPRLARLFSRPRRPAGS